MLAVTLLSIAAAVVRTEKQNSQDVVSAVLTDSAKVQASVRRSGSASVADVANHLNLMAKGDVPVGMPCYDAVANQMAENAYKRSLEEKPTGWLSKIGRHIRHGWEDFINDPIGPQGLGNCKQPDFGVPSFMLDSMTSRIMQNQMECIGAPWLPESQADAHSDAFFMNHRCLVGGGRRPDQYTDSDGKALHCGSGLVDKKGACCHEGGELIKGFHGHSSHILDMEAEGYCCSGALDGNGACAPHTCDENAFAHNPRDDMPQLACTSEGAVLVKEKKD